MRLVIQRVKNAEVKVDGKTVGQIEQGLFVLLGIHQEDSSKDVDWLIQKLIKIRIFNDEQGKMNYSVRDVQGQLLVVSQFTLYAACKKGNRPSYTRAARPEQAIPLYEEFIAKAEAELGQKVATGQFGADMQIELNNDGPVTIILDSITPEIF
ncbi:D-tyrosyl-tRNA(Tyr) deacylase [Saprospira grandis DSM 2844]|uniref:D-aminoacyl-tRNA deacylase n=1 Tax=Saprospira grandis DSM 2844 TaxID=694433 RepID=J0P7C8_9BACT|nr:D-aminoacyl-tRNA deacylase [Saprospira grandis]EJF53417.1 D-tyrosyl-tRNA(Tyr) deacylase [Saprospira grandis DSM 2844]